MKVVYWKGQLNSFAFWHASTFTPIAQSCCYQCSIAVELGIYPPLAATEVTSYVAMELGVSLYTW